MFTIDRLAKLDAIANAVFKALSSGLDWLDLKYEDFLVNTTYRVVEAKAAAIDKAEEKISDLEDAGCELRAYVASATAMLVEKHKAALAALGHEVAAKQEKLRADLAAAAEAVVAARKAYDATIKEADEKLDVGVEV